ncbi:hypothetical protein [Caulobacter hibisci]|uniref:Lipoprotein n=1 Tax=Caulobacter hibisci TaxID=2035993 RepID=A0ABS0ST04_9CAUL|nr:hypothetical protein [Caulobacter hibisci]MBI1682713.1 hypothetical protein [Caulobacter hibisci]
MKLAPPTLIALALAFAGCERPAAAVPPLPMAAAGTAEASQAPRTIAPGDRVADLAAALPDARLTILDGYPWARFAIARGGKRLAVVQFDGENEELADGRNSQQAIGAQVGWSALKPGLRVVKVEPGAAS